jgi:hypothetical protein
MTNTTTRSSIPAIAPQGLLLAQPEPQGRWAEPYQPQNGGGVWTCYLRRPLSRRQKEAGLLSCVSAMDLDSLNELQRLEDEKAARLSGRMFPA